MPNTPLRKKTIEVASSPYGGDGAVHATQYSNYFELEINAWLTHAYKSMSDDEARALRDALIELYPVEKVAPAAIYETDKCGSYWRVVRTVMVPMAPSRDVYAHCYSEEAAQRIAAILNAQENTTNAAP